MPEPILPQRIIPYDSEYIKFIKVERNMKDIEKEIF
jgi:hypothetical protein